MASAGRIVTKTSQALSNNITKNAPASWQALLAHPPPPSLTRGVIQRSADDLPSKLVQSAQSQGRRRKAGKDLKARLKPQPIVWKEDYIVDKLYADHPWERHRAISVTESGELDNEQLPDSQDLSLWSPKPSIFLTARFVLHLQEVHQMPLAQAYTSAVVQFRALRATFEAATKFAQLEAEFYGAQFGGGRIEAGLRAEEKVMDQWSTHQGASTSSNSAATPSSFTSLLDNSYSQPVDSLPWSGGKEYLRPQRRRPLQEESQTVLSPETSENQSDFSSSSDEQGLLLHALGGSNMPATHPLREPGVQPAPVEMDQYNGRHQPQQNRRAFKMVHRMIKPEES